MSDEPRDFTDEFDLAKAEEAGRSLASVIVAFRNTLAQEQLPTDIVDQLTVAYGTGIIARIMLMSNVPIAEAEEGEI